jgi:hypothetical protein
MTAHTLIQIVAHDGDGDFSYEAEIFDDAVSVVLGSIAADGHPIVSVAAQHTLDPARRRHYFMATITYTAQAKELP